MNVNYFHRHYYIGSILDDDEKITQKYRPNNKRKFEISLIFPFRWTKCIV